MPIACLVTIAVLILAISVPAVAGDLLPGYRKSLFFGEQVRNETTDTGIVMRFIAPGKIDPKKPTLLIVFATPNGNTAEQTLGCDKADGLHWHYDIQHIAAQTRVMRELDTRGNIVLCCVQAEALSWPAWRTEHEGGSRIIRELVERERESLPGSEVRVALSCHSGGGSFVSGFVDAYDTCPRWVTRIAFLDANYSYSNELGHGDKFLAWLRSNPGNHLVVIVYDDRNITLDGKKVVGPTGGTYRATYRMLGHFKGKLELTHSMAGDMERFAGMNGQVNVFIHRNPANRILHTALVGDMNGQLEAMTLGTPEEKTWGKFGGPRAYTKRVQSADISVQPIPPRPANAAGGKRFMEKTAKLPRAEREVEILKQIERGNVPEFMREWVPIHIEGKDAKGKAHTAIYQVTPDYLALGSNEDFVRVPLTPMTAQPIAELWGCCLPTRKMSDDIYKAAAVKLEPKPMTKDRETVETFVQHNAIIESQRAGKKLGLLVGGTKKDVVMTNLLAERAHRVAIYGWHQLDGKPIQPLTTVHVDWYVDYSHGIRLIKRAAIVDGRQRDIRDVLRDPNLCVLFSDEGPIARVSCQSP